MSHSKLHSNFAAGFLLFLCFITWNSAAIAQTGIKISSTQDVILTFYKVGGAYPNFEKWIKKNPPYNVTPVGRRKEAYQMQLAELMGKYDAIDPKSDYLTIRTSVNLDTKQTYNYELEKYVSSLRMRFVEAPEAEYFPYDFMGDRFAVVPMNLQEHMSAIIPNEQFVNFKRILRSSEEAIMILQLKPVQADASKPVKMDGIYHWILMTDIASISLWAHTGALLWEYTAPWYVSPTTEKLMDLYVEPEQTP